MGDCAGCSGGKKVGNLGGGGSVTINNMTAPADGTYLMTLDYVDGSSSRTAVVTVDGTSFQLPLGGTNDNDLGRRAVRDRARPPQGGREHDRLRQPGRVRLRHRQDHRLKKN